MKTPNPLTASTLLDETASRHIVSVHNHLILARFGYLAVAELRSLFYMLRRTHDINDEGPIRVYFADVVKELPNQGGCDYKLIKQAIIQGLMTKLKTVEVLWREESGRFTYQNMVVIDTVRYTEGESYADVFWGQKVRPYLVHLKENITEVDLGEIDELQAAPGAGVHAVRFHLIIKVIQGDAEYRDGLEMEPEDLHKLLVGDKHGKYTEYKVLKRDLIVKNQKALSNRSTAFELTEIRRGRNVHKIVIVPKHRDPRELLPATVDATAAIVSNQDKRPRAAAGQSTPAQLTAAPEPVPAAAPIKTKLPPDLEKRFYEKGVWAIDTLERLYTGPVDDAYFGFVIDRTVADQRTKTNKAKDLGGVIMHNLKNGKFKRAYELSRQQPQLPLAARPDPLPPGNDQGVPPEWVSNEEALENYRRFCAKIPKERTPPLYSAFILYLKTRYNVMVTDWDYTKPF